MMLVFIESPVNVVKNKKVNNNDNQTWNNRKTCKLFDFEYRSMYVCALEVCNDWNTYRI